MAQALWDSDFFESEEEGVQRELVLGRLNGMVRDWVRQVALEKGLPASVAAETTGQIYTFGSYRLGVHSRGADIDTLCVVPQHATRADFFHSFPELLMKCAAPGTIGELTAVPDAYVPVLKLKMDGICIDLVFAQLALPSIPPDLDLLDSNLLRGLDEKDILSLNGSRVTDEMLQLIPSIPAFHGALRCIKLWAKRRGLYSNAMGYFGGVALALMTARICQLYPAAAPASLVQRFFKIFQQWPWPQPVYLRPIEDLLPSLAMKVWNPRVHVSDRFHRMPVITPAYPSMCSTHNVTASTLRLITEEFRRGSELMLRIEQRRATWADLLAPTDFFCRYRHFFQIIAVAETEESFRVWSGFLNSKIRHLTPKLELDEHIEAAPPFHEGFEIMVDSSSAKEGENALDAVRAAHFYDPDRIETEAEAHHLSDGDSRKQYYTMAFYVAMMISPAAFQQQQGGGSSSSERRAPRRICLDEPINDFRRFIAAYDRITPDMHIIIRDIKRDSLPNYVFESTGQARPPRSRRITSRPRPPASNLNAPSGISSPSVTSGSGSVTATTPTTATATTTVDTINPMQHQLSPTLALSIGSPKRTRTEDTTTLNLSLSSTSVTNPGEDQ